MDADFARGTSLHAVCIFGPTGSGKTDLALELARWLPLEIISVDSAMVYRQMDIGTAKPSAAQRQSVPHHLIDIRDPWESYSAGCFRADALGLIESVNRRGRIPLLVGGTLLYFRALMEDLASLPSADVATRARIGSEADELGWPAMHARLTALDPVAAARIAVNDRQRIQRALEVYDLTGRPISEWQRQPGRPHGVRFSCVALWPADRAALYTRLDQRLEAMVREGLVEEVAHLRALPGITVGSPAMRAVGYRQFWQYLDGQLAFGEAQRQAAVATRRLAKRQLTWMRATPADLRLQVPRPDSARTVAEWLADDRGVALAPAMQYHGPTERMPGNGV